MNEDLKLIKKHYGEEMMHYARDNFSSILENEGELSKLFLDNFAESKTLFENLKENDELIKFKNYIFDSFKEKIDKIDVKIESIKTPKELLSEAGYILYECKTEEEIQTFKKYYSEGEELCTFKGGRLDRCYVFFAVKKDVNQIKRENFKNPERQDQYGTSVISIQFSKDGTNMLSIKNRYNHRVKNTIIQFGKPTKLEKEKYVVMNSYILNLQDKSFYVLYRNDDDYFTRTIENINKIEVLKTIKIN